MLAAMGVSMSACGSPAARNGSDVGDLPPELTTPVAGAQEAGLRAYWVGPEFEAGGRTFHATGGRFEDHEEPSFVNVYYQSPSEGGGSVGFWITFYPPEQWESAKARVLPRSTDVTRQSIIVHGWSAQLFSIPVGRWTNQLVIVDAPDGIIVTRGNASISNFRQVNPLNDPDVLLAVLENLRPYPD